MAQDIDGDENVTIETKKSNRPDGLDENRYSGMNKWTFHRWAWEFLRRNDKFIEDCRRVEFGSEEEQLAVAKLHHMRQFKSFSEAYMKGKPLFSIGRFRIRDNLNYAGKTKIESISLAPGQVLFRFDLEFAMYDSKAIDRQLVMAEKQVRQRFVTYQKNSHRNSKSSKPKAKYFGIYIRLLDYLNTGKTFYDCAKLVFPEEDKLGFGKEEMRILVKNQIRSARSHAKDKFRSLALLEGAPGGEEILLYNVGVPVPDFV